MTRFNSTAAVSAFIDAQADAQAEAEHTFVVLVAAAMTAFELADRFYWERQDRALGRLFSEHGGVIPCGCPACSGGHFQGGELEDECCKCASCEGLRAEWVARNPVRYGVWFSAVMADEAEARATGENAWVVQSRNWDKRRELGLVLPD